MGRLEHRALLETPEVQDHKDPKEIKVHEGQLAKLDPRDLQGRQGPLVQRVIPVLWGRMGTQEPKELRDLVVLMETRARQEKQVHPETPGLEVYRVTRDHKGAQDLQELQGPLGQPVTEEIPVSRVPLGLQAGLVLLGPLVFGVTPVRLELQVNLAYRVPRVKPVVRVQRGLRVFLDPGV